MAEHTRFAVCINNSGYAASLELRKLYEVIADPVAEQDAMIRIVDESGEDYLYSADRFVFAPLPVAVEQAVLHATENGVRRSNPQS
ncbi:MAG TPA: hypothetical protein VJZ00_10230 [Thermoanaerobaculia bacterium]|nr:hypothetical protein [Thermoanaerobaculia bacterium]